MKSTNHHLTQAETESIYALFNKIGDHISEISFLGRGEGSVVYKVRTDNKVYCLKMALFPERTMKVLNEAKIREDFLFQGLKFLTHPIYIDEDIIPNGAVIYDYIEGEMAIFKDKKIISQMARYLAKIHNLDYKIIPNGFQHILSFFQNLNDTIQSIKNRYSNLMNDSIKSAFAAALAEYHTLLQDNQDIFTHGITSILHGDLSNNFILDHHGKLWLIDWENSEYGDCLEEVSNFVFDNDLEAKFRDYFFAEYQKHFSPATSLNLEKIAPFYVMVIPVFNICWGIDQLSTNLQYKLEPERKLRDLALSAQNWIKFFTESTATFIIEGISKLKSHLIAIGQIE
ncbi:aminoglycoside phosphotransferase family protein [Promethearchaeum syntrophicum]|uniref:Aminoglycoside phosphotransferase family protein n=1 Tax=Promethearchaeum syntrophicum TaxID=2594042 RepID=A0A5B9DFT5_9ARCH|nr:aminoglycoside phosphotransferase family protein [Candidatus Prometheoarchaeum syntrophicum]QEE17577.1 Phosphotransferase enzyme family protein [Candidatus Prometheoarchaeum syntrophicum]